MPEKPNKDVIGRVDGREKLFARGILMGLKGDEAAQYAGFHETGSRSIAEIANELIKKPEVRDLILEYKRLRDVGECEHEVDKEEICQVLSHIIQSNLSSYLDDDGLPNAALVAARGDIAVKSLTINKTGSKIELYDKLRAIEILSRLRGYSGSDAERGAITIDAVESDM